jgi:hypothetical protein
VKPSRDLRRLQDSGVSRVARLRDSVEECITSPVVRTSSDRDRYVSQGIIELHNLWYQFSRCLYLSSAFRARDGSGSRIALAKVGTARSMEDALTHAIRRTKIRAYQKKAGKASPMWTWSDEPPWASSKILLDTLDEIGASNYQTVAAGLSTPTAVAPHLTRVRNFYAHRSKGTSTNLGGVFNSYLLPANEHPSVTLLRHARSGGVPRPQPLILDWIDDIAGAITLVI